jgi:hypothetical protein
MTEQRHWVGFGPKRPLQEAMEEEEQWVGPYEKRWLWMQ